MCEKSLELKNITPEEHYKISSEINGFLSKLADLIIRNDLSKEEKSEILKYYDSVIDSYIDRCKKGIF